MRIAYLNNHYQLGGAETVMRQLHGGLRSRGVSSRILVAEGKRYPYGSGVSPLYPRSLSRLDHSRFRKWVRRWAPRGVWTDRAVASLHKRSFDLIHVHSFHGLYAQIETFAQLAHRKPLVWTFHRFWGVTGGCDHPFGCERYLTGCGSCPQVGNFAVGPVDRTAEEWHRKLEHLAPAPLTIVAPSRHLAKVVSDSPIGRNWRVEVIPNGVDPTAFAYARKQDPRFRKKLGIHPEKTVLLFTNREFRDPIKGWPVIRDAINALPPDGRQLVLAGGNSSWAREQIREDWDVVDMGYVANRQHLASLYEAADTFLYASDGENFPCAILEAMSSQCCIVSTPVDGVTEQIEHGISGWLAKGMDSPTLRAALSHCLANPALIKRLGKAARKRVEANFTESAMVERYLRLYNRILSRE